LEFGQMFRRFGSRVTIVQRAGQVLPREDPDIAEEITKILREDEVDVLLNATAKRVEEGDDGSLTLTVTVAGQLGRVGLSESEARQQRRDVRVFKMPMSSIARAVELDEARGFVKAVVDTATDKILGCAVLGIEGGELMSMLQIAMAAGVPFTRVRDMIFAHPTLAEGLNTLFDED